jgi:hypothetical protein
MFSTRFAEDLSFSELPNDIIQSIIKLIDNFLDSNDGKYLFSNGSCHCYTCNGEGGWESDAWNPSYEHHNVSHVCDTCEGDGRICFDRAALADIEQEIRSEELFHMVIPNGCIDAEVFMNALGFKLDSWRRDQGALLKFDRKYKLSQDPSWEVHKKIISLHESVEGVRISPYTHYDHLVVSVQFEFGIVREEMIDYVKEKIEYITAKAVQIAGENFNE